MIVELKSINRVCLLNNSLFNQSVDEILQVFILFHLINNATNLSTQNVVSSDKLNIKSFNPFTVLWYNNPALKWEDALSIGNGRPGATVFGKNREERIQLNEETYWSGGPYSTVVKDGYKFLPEIQVGQGHGRWHCGRGWAMVTGQTKFIRVL